MKTKEVWTGTTRRAFVQLLGLGAVALAAVKVGKPEATEPRAPRPPTLWIGHC